jgi:hypothetical protein
MRTVDPDRQHRQRLPSGRLRPHRPAGRRPERPARVADWLVLAYLAGDNDLERALLDDLNEMERVGSRPGQVEILAQVDRAAGFDASGGDWTSTRRYYVTRGNHPRRISSRLLADLGETNTGDPRVLADFIRFGVRAYPARACALILSNHGSGFYVPPEMQGARMAPGVRPAVRRRPFFNASRAGQEHRAAAITQVRGIAYDDDAWDCLDNQELKRVLREAHRTLGRKVDLVGMDACLMTMLEVAYQIRDDACMLVGSEELEPNAGWPHEVILGELIRKPAMTAAELGGQIVRRYIESYELTAEEATQSAIDLSRLELLVEAVDQLAAALLESLTRPGLDLAVHAAWRTSVRFFNGVYVDLYDFARNLGSVTHDTPPVHEACRAIVDIMDGPASPVLATAHVGERLRTARGLSIYFPPFRDPSVQYRDLDLARRTRWADFLDAFLRHRR